MRAGRRACRAGLILAIGRQECRDGTTCGNRAEHQGLGQAMGRRNIGWRLTPFVLGLAGRVARFGLGPVRHDAPAGPEHFFEPGVRGEQSGIPIVYDACWDIGAEVFGAHNGFQFTAAATQGTVSRPSMGENYNDGFQVLTRLGYEVTSGPLFGLRFGATGSVGPYLNKSIVEDPDFPAGADPESYLNTALGLDLAYARGPWRFFGEVGRVGYEVPNVDPTLSVVSYYLEAIRSLGPSWAVAVRQETAVFSDITAGTQSGSWDYDVWSWEATVNYRFRRGARVRIGYQDARYPDAPEYDTNLFALQLQVWTR